MKRIPAFFSLGDIYQRMASDAKAFKVRQTSISGYSYASADSKVTAHRLKQPIVVSQPGLIRMCTRNEWYIIGLIMDEMYEYNVLWRSDSNLKRTNTTYKLGIAGLVKKGILITTETPHIYIVNPMYIRRGDPFAVTATTANMLMNRKPDDSMLCDKRPVQSFDFSRALPGAELD